MPFTIVRQDITRMQVDAVVNAANTQLSMGGGVCGAIFSAAGPSRLQAACKKLAPIETGDAVITPGFALQAKFIIHTAGPIYYDWKQEQSEALLRSSYLNSLLLAEEHGCKSIAFPLISSGIYGYPKADALRIASQTIQDFLNEHEMDVYLAVFGKDAFIASQELMGSVRSYIDEHYVAAHTDPRRRLENRTPDSAPPHSDFSTDEAVSELFGQFEQSMNLPTGFPSSPNRESAPDKQISKEKKSLFPRLDSLISKLDEPFNTTLLQLIDEKGKTDSEVYKRANIDRKLFSKIRKGQGYLPSKRTILALAISLELTLPETSDLLEKAGYALSHSQKFDVIVEYFIISRRYDIFEINEVLFQYDQPLLGNHG